MAYQNKINWSDARKGGDLMFFTVDPLKAAVLDYHIQIEGELEDIIRMAFRDPDKFKTNRMDFSRRVSLVRALIGKSPDDEIWEIVNKLADLRNKFAHKTRTTDTQDRYRLHSAAAAKNRTRLHCRLGRG